MMMRCCIGTLALVSLWEISSRPEQKRQSSCRWNSAIQSICMKGTLLGAHCAVILSALALSVRGTEPGDQHLPPPVPVPVVPKQKYIVGIAPGPPFNIQGSDGTWTGISVELWREIANELQLDFEFR